jgi:hypothetical protein
MTYASDENLARKHRKIFAFASVAGVAFIAGLFAYYGSLVYQARGYEGFARFSNVMISIAIVPGGIGLVWGWRSARSKRQKWLWLLITGSAITGVLAWVYYLKPDIRLAVIIVGLMVVGLCVLRAWMWLADKASKKIETRAAKRMGLTPEQYEARKPTFRFDLGGWPFQSQVEGQSREYNGWIVIGGLSCAYALGKCLLILAN